METEIARKRWRELAILDVSVDAKEDRRRRRAGKKERKVGG